MFGKILIVLFVTGTLHCLHHQEIFQEIEIGIGNAKNESVEFNAKLSDGIFGIIENLTTLVKNLYKHLCKKDHFDICKGEKITTTPKTTTTTTTTTTLSPTVDISKCKRKPDGSVDCRNLRPRKDCLAFLRAGANVDGLYKLQLRDTVIDVYCDQTSMGGGWTVFQRRKEGRENFNRNWEDYSKGFGNVQKDFWLGNDYLHELTMEESSLLINATGILLEMEFGDQNSGNLWRKYEYFGIDGVDQHYKVHVSGSTGNIVNDLFIKMDGKTFTTYDGDNEGVNCARKKTGGGWWWDSYCNNNLNGEYQNLNGVLWKHHGCCDWYIFNVVELKVRRNIP